MSISSARDQSCISEWLFRRQNISAHTVAKSLAKQPNWTTPKKQENEKKMKIERKRVTREMLNFLTNLSRKHTRERCKTLPPKIFGHICWEKKINRFDRLINLLLFWGRGRVSSAIKVPPLDQKWKQSVHSFLFQFSSFLPPIFGFEWHLSQQIALKVSWAFLSLVNT